MQVLNVDGIKFGNTKLILPTAKFSLTPVFFLYSMLYTASYLYCVLITDHA